MDDLLNVHDFARAAAETMATAYYDYYAGGAGDGLTLAENEAAFRRVRLYHRVLRGLKARDLRASIGGHHLSMPLFIAPTGFHRLAHPEGELATVRAAGEAGVLMILSTASTTPLETVLAAATGPVWFQLYMMREREVTAGIIDRAAAAGCQAIVLTVDTPVLGKRERDIHNRFTLPPDLELSNFAGQIAGAMPAPTGGSGLAAYTEAMFKWDLSWADVDWLRDRSRLPLWLKGIGHPDDARRAIDHGVDGLIVSNHGGRQLDGGPATIDLLPDVVRAVDGRLPLLLDGGVRRGADIVKALALGAQGVGVGRAPLWGLAVGGQAGVTRVLEIIREELDTCLALCGLDSVDAVNGSLIFEGRNQV